MWTLVVWFFLAPADVRALTSVPGFSSVKACEAAGPVIAGSMPESEKARISFVCVKQ